jgi:hypothetical protein
MEGMGRAMHFSREKLTPPVIIAVLLIASGALALGVVRAYTSPVPYLLVAAGFLCLLGEDAYHLLKRRRLSNARAARQTQRDQTPPR